ncbi:Proteasome activator BLM10, partial [Dipsacomyces acuminosporus]
WPSIERLARDTERPGAQRTASEMIAGLLRGSKHWSKDALSWMWERLLPLVDSILARLRPDSIRFWQMCLQFSFARRDPRRYLPLVRLLIYGNPFDPVSEAPFTEATKLELLRVLVGSWDWRIASAIVASKPRLLDALAHPYKQVRDAAGVLMYMLSSSEFAVTYTSVDSALRSIASCGPTGLDFSHWQGTPRTIAMIGEMNSKIAQWKAEHKPSNEGTSNYSRGCKTLLNFLLAGFGYCSKRLAIEHIPAILPLLSSLQEQHDDEDVSRLAKVILDFFSQILYTSRMSKD